MGDARARGEGDRVKNQHNLAIAKHGGAVDTDHPGQLLADVLDDDFAVALQFIDLHGDALQA